MNIVAPILQLLGLFAMALLVAGVLVQTGGTMKERAALVFEVYRYTVCFVMVIVFGLMAYTVVTGLLAGSTDPGTLGASGVGVVLSLVLYCLHMFMKNPHQEKVEG